MTKYPGRFNEGDRVVYTGRSPRFHQPHRMGDAGTVEATYLSPWSEQPSVRVTWDNGTSFGHYPENLAHEDSSAGMAAQVRRGARDMREQAAVMAAGAEAADTLADLIELLPA